jgi:hypothetical protein
LSEMSRRQLLLSLPALAVVPRMFAQKAHRSCIFTDPDGLLLQLQDVKYCGARAFLATSASAKHERIHSSQLAKSSIFSMFEAHADAFCIGERDSVSRPQRLGSIFERASCEWSPQLAIVR